MSEVITFFIKKIDLVGEGSFFCNVLLRTTFFAFKGNWGFERILIEDSEGLKEWVGTLPGTHSCWKTKLFQQLNFIKMEITNSSFQTDHETKFTWLVVKDKIKKENINIVKFGEMKKISIFYHGYGRDKRYRWDIEKHLPNNSENFTIKSGGSVQGEDETWFVAVSKIKFEGINSNLAKKIRKNIVLCETKKEEMEIQSSLILFFFN